MTSQPIRDRLADHLITPENAAFATGQAGTTLPELAELLEDDPPLDRTTVNSWAEATLAAEREVILVDYAGVGSSTGEPSHTIASTARQVIAARGGE